MDRVKMLSLLPDCPFDIEDRVIEQIIFSVFDIEKPSEAEASFYRYRKILERVFPSLNVADLFSSKHTQNEIVSNLPLLKDFFRGYLFKNLGYQQTFPGLRLLAGSDPELPKQRFSDGYHVPGIVYCSHPRDEQFWIPMANFHPYLINDKRAEFHRIAADLGAKEIRLIEETETSRSMGATVGVTSPEIPPVSFGPSSQGGKKRSFTLFSRFDRVPGKRPTPPSISRWLPLEPLWQEMIRARMENGASSFVLEFEYSYDFEVTMKLAMKLDKMGFNLGGKFARPRRVLQKLKVVFFSRDELRNP